MTTTHVTQMSKLYKRCLLIAQNYVNLVHFATFKGNSSFVTTTLQLTELSQFDEKTAANALSNFTDSCLLRTMMINNYFSLHCNVFTECHCNPTHSFHGQRRH